MSKILTKSQTELDLLPIPQEAKDVISNIIDKFSDQGHSGSSAGYLIPRVIAYANKTQEEIEQLLYTKLVDNEDEDDMQRWITDNVKDLVREIEPLKGPYLNFYLDVLKKAMHQEAVTPITFEDDQWNDVSEYYGDTEKRLISIKEHGMYLKRVMERYINQIIMYSIILKKIMLGIPTISVQKL